MTRLAFSPRDPVYVGEHKGEKEYWFTDDRFAEVTGGEAAFKKELFDEGLLEREKRGECFNYVVKRQLPDGRRAYFVVIRHKREKPSAPNPTPVLNPTLALAAPVSLATVAKTVRRYHPR